MKNFKSLLIPFTIIVLLFFCYSTGAHAQRKSKNQKKTEPEIVISPEEQKAIQLAEAREKHAEELLANTRVVTFFDSIVVAKDDFLSKLQLTTESGRYTSPNTLFDASTTSGRSMGNAAFINGLSNAVYFSASDESGVLRLYSSFRNATHWTSPTVLEGIDGFEYQDYPFLLSDGSTLYFSAEGDESIGGMDIFVTRYNNETKQFVRPENVGFPFNSPANDYLLAIDEATKTGILVTDRRQPDDKVCIYWFIADEEHDTYDYDEDDEESVARIKSFAAIESINDTQHDPDATNKAKQARLQAINKSNTPTTVHHRYVISDRLVYTSLSQFTSESARSKAVKWSSDQDTYNKLTTELNDLRRSYAITRSDKTAQSIRNIEVQLAQLKNSINQVAKEFRAEEHKALKIN